MISRLFVVVLALSACRSPCQQLCVRMADYATECGLNVSDAALDACIADQASSDNQAACRQSGDADTLRQEWACEDLEVFFAP